MKAMRAMAIQTFEGPAGLRKMDLPRPVPGPGEVLVRVVSAGVNPIEAGFETARNISLDACRYDWVLWIDCDEKLLDPQALAGAGRAFASHGDPLFGENLEAGFKALHDRITDR